MANGEKKQMTLPVSIVVNIITVLVAVVATFYISQGKTETCLTDLRNKDDLLEYRIDRNETDFKDAVIEIKDLIKELNTKIDELD